LRPGMLEHGRHQLAAEAAAAPARDARDRELRCLLVDEAEAWRAGREEAVPRSPDRTRFPRDEPRIAGPAPVVHVAGDGQVRILVQAPVVGVLEHVAEETDVLRPRPANHAEQSTTRWNARTVGAPLGTGRPARAAKNPATAAASAPAPGKTSHGCGPPSSRRLGSQNATSKRPSPTHARFQSTSNAVAPLKQRLSLRT